MTHQLHSNENRGSAYAGQLIYQTCNLSSEENLIEETFFRAGPFNRALIRNRNFIDLNAFMHRRSVYQRSGGFNENMRRLVDWELIVRYTTDESPVYVPALLSNYYMDLADNQITKVENYLDSLREYKHSLTATSPSSPALKPTAQHALFFIFGCSDNDKLDSTLASIITSANACGFGGEVSVALEFFSHEIQSKYSGHINFFLTNSASLHTTLRQTEIVYLIKEGRHLSTNFFTYAPKSLSDGSDHCYVIPKILKYDRLVSLEQPYATDTGFIDNTIPSSDWPLLKYDSFVDLNTRFVKLTQINSSNVAGIVVTTETLGRIGNFDDFDEIVAKINALSYMGMLTIVIHDRCTLIEN